MTPDWHGDAELLIYRDNARLPVVLDLYRKPAKPGLHDRWAGTFAAERLHVLTPGRGVVYLPDGSEAEVMVEGFDVLTGKGDFIGLAGAPF